MPRKQLNIPCKMEHLSILNEAGEVDNDLEPDIPEDLLLKLYRAMLLGRRFDERMLSLQRQGRIGTFAPTSGQEASQVGSAAVLRPTDWMVPSFREAAAQIWRGAPMENIILYFGGYNEGGRIEDNSKDLPISVPVASQILHAVGLGWAVNYRKTDEVVMTFFGDGATSEGDFHEGMNFAGVYQTPVIFLCQNNHWAISVPRSKQTRSETLAQKALGYGIPGIQVDGNDILAVYAAAKEAVDRARSGGGPTMIECVTYRITMHTTADDPKRYRTDEEVEGWKKKDPLVRFEKYLTDKGVAAKDTFQALETEVKEDIQTAVDRAEELMKKLDDPLHMFEHAYAELPPSLKEQRAELAEELKGMHKEK
ncbi:MAG: pyruvate dehydrogenase (acetyl-transferring) E1 component subunit alpha [Desulfobacterales bacterium]|jgi:pyruvate dehydrogenase E1 component alpha subunit|nr:pyruvate dehydrogenase (acetyl-transferring) E1 component subunit alpha [Desulfobacterales bacterium]